MKSYNNYHKKHIRLISILMLILLAMCFSSCGNNETPGNKKNTALFQEPDFSYKLTAAGEQKITDFDSIYEWFSNYKVPTFPIAEELYNSKQTYYDNEELLNGQSVDEENKLDCFSYLIDFLYAVDLKDITFTKDVWTQSDDGKMYYMTDEALPSEYAGLLLVDVSMDLTTNSVILRSAVRNAEENGSGYAAYSIVTFTKNTSVYQIHTEIHEFDTAEDADIVLIDTCNLAYFEDDDHKIKSFAYSSHDESTTVTEIFFEENGGMYADLLYEVDVLDNQSSFELINNRYSYTRETNYYYAGDTYNIDDAKLDQQIQQSLSYSNGHYVLTEHVLHVSDGANIQTLNILVYG